MAKKGSKGRKSNNRPPKSPKARKNFAAKIANKTLSRKKKIPEVRPNKKFEPKDLRGLIKPKQTKESSSFKLPKESAQVQNGSISVDDLQGNDLRRNIKRSIRQKSDEIQRKVDKRLAREQANEKRNEDTDMDLMKADDVKNKKNLGITIPRNKMGFGSSVSEILRNKTKAGEYGLTVNQKNKNNIPTKLIVQCGR